MTPDPEEAPSPPNIVPESPVPSPSGTTRDATDGRIALRLRNRQRVIEALIELVDDGDLSPSMEDLVERSGVSERSIFRYFTDLADLSVAAIRAVVERAAPSFLLADIGEGPLEDRVDAIIAARLRVAEQTHAFGTLSRRHLALTPEIQQALTNTVDFMRSQFAAQFARELGAMPDDEAVIVTDILLTLFTYEGLEVMWNQLGNDHEAIARRWRTTMMALLSSKS